MQTFKELTTENATKGKQCSKALQKMIMKNPPNVRTVNRLHYHYHHIVVHWVINPENVHLSRIGGT